MRHSPANPFVTAILLYVCYPLFTLSHDLYSLQVEMFVDNLWEQRKGGGGINLQLSNYPNCAACANKTTEMSLYYFPGTWMISTTHAFHLEAPGSHSGCKIIHFFPFRALQLLPRIYSGSYSRDPPELCEQTERTGIACCLFWHLAWIWGVK